VSAPPACGPRARPGNASLGIGTGASLTTGDNNTLLGANAGAALTTGSHNTAPIAVSQARPVRIVGS
jgi:hypothetical protein